MPRKLASMLIALVGVPFAVSAAELPGSWSAEVDGTAYELVFDEEGGLSVIEANEAVVVAQYEAGGGELTINDLGGKKACQGDQSEGTYRYTLEGGTLSLTLAEDDCSKRAAYLDGTTFQAN